MSIPPSSSSPDGFNWEMPKLDLPGDPAIWISLATGPMLIGLIGSRAWADLMWQIGSASEELFRGDRLPVLDGMVPRPASPPPPTDDPA